MAECLIMFNDEWVPEHTPEQLRGKAVAGLAVVEEMREAGVLIYTNGGLDRATAVCGVVSENGVPVVTEGPYAETAERFGGFAVVDVADDDDARYWAGRLAVALEWPQEVHRFPGAGQRGGGAGETAVR